MSRKSDLFFAMLSGLDNSLSGWRSEAETQEITKGSHDVRATSCSRRMTRREAGQRVARPTY
jgi:hypothetical protein